MVALDPDTLQAAEAGPAACRIELVVGDVRDAALARRAVTGADAVIHLAANTGVGPSVADPARDCSINVLGTLNYLEACRHGGVGRFRSSHPAARRSATASRRSTKSCRRTRSRPMAPASLPARPIVRPISAASAMATPSRCASAIATWAVCRATKAASSLSSFAKRWPAQPWEIYGDGAQTSRELYLCRRHRRGDLRRRHSCWHRRRDFSDRDQRRDNGAGACQRRRCARCWSETACRPMASATPRHAAATSSALIPISARRAVEARLGRAREPAGWARPYGEMVLAARLVSGETRRVKGVLREKTI